MTGSAAQGEGRQMEALIREFLWEGHGHNLRLYGDDGEMQCHGCKIWDYRRAPLEELVPQALEARNQARLAALASQESTPRTQPLSLDEQAELLEWRMAAGVIFKNETPRDVITRIKKQAVELAHPPSEGKLRELIAKLRDAEREMLRRANDSVGSVEQRFRGRGNGYRDAAAWLEAVLEAQS